MRGVSGNRHSYRDLLDGLECAVFRVQGIPKGHKRRNSSEWSFHSEELQRSPAPGKPCNPARSALAKRVSAKYMTKIFRTNMPHTLASGQQRNLG